MTANLAHRLRSVAWLLLAAIVTAGLGLFIGAPNSATAAVYVYGGPGGTVANTNEVEIHYLWSTDSDRVSVGLLQPIGLEAVWTNLSDTTSAPVVLTINDSLNPQTPVVIQTPTNSWSLDTKVSLKVRDRGSTSSPNLSGIRNYGFSTNKRMFEVISLGSFPNFTSLQGAFSQTSGQLRISAQLPSTVTDLSYAFESSKFNGDLSGWDTSRVSNFKQTFYQASEFNQPLSAWDVGSATDMSNMFSGATKFNQNIGSWDVSKVMDMRSMFFSAWAFNNGDQTVSDTVPGQYPLSWNTPSLSNMATMFYYATAFNQSLDSWTVGRVTDMKSAFYNASRFNNGDPKNAYEGDASNSNVVMSWSFSAAADMTQTFYNASNFNQNLNSWDVSKVTKMDSTFEGAVMFNNGDLNRAFIDPAIHSVKMSWSPSASTTFQEMFKSANKFNQNLNSWNVAKGTNFESMFNSAYSFNNGHSRYAYDQDTYSATVEMPWSTSAATKFTSMFEGASAFNQNISSWSLSAVTHVNRMFHSAVDFNNGFAPGSPGVLPWKTGSTADSEYFTDTFNGAKSFNQDITSWNSSQVTKLLRTFFGASSFNNGDPIGAYEGDGLGSDVQMLWDTSNVTSLESAFSGAVGFNQNISSWTVSKVMTMKSAFGQETGPSGVFNNGASSMSSNTLAWSTPALNNLECTFCNLQYFNADISSWNTSGVAALNSTFFNAKSFNQDVSNWNVSKVTSLRNAFVGAESFAQDLTKWGSYKSINNLDLSFVGATRIPDFFARWDVTGVTTFDSVFANVYTSQNKLQNAAVLKSIIGSWSLQKVQRGKTLGYFRTPLWDRDNCREWSAYQRLDVNYDWAFQGSGHTSTVPTCNNVTVTWSPTTTIANSNGTFTPDSLATTDGPSGVRYATHYSGSTSCTVDAISGEIRYVSSGSCEIVAYDADTNSNTAATSAFRVVVFQLPTPGSESTPSAPLSVSAVAGIGELGIRFSAPSSNGGLPLTRYEVGYSLTQGGATTWVSVSPVVTSSPTLSFTLSGLVNGTSYWVKARAFNSLGAGAASSEYGPVTPATTPSAPGVSSSTVSAGTVILNLSVPGTDGGAAITAYEYRFASNSSAVQSAAWVNTGTTATSITVSGLVNGETYYFQVRAVNSVGASSATVVSSALTPFTTSSPPVIIFSTKIMSQNSAEIQFLAPSNDGGAAILDYQVRSSTDYGDNWSAWSDQSVFYSANVQRWGMSLTGLQGSVPNPVPYIFEIRARNAAGYSGGSLQVPSYVPVDEVRTADQKIIMDFRAAKYSGNLPILGYEYQYRTVSILTPGTTSPWISISPSVWSAATPTTTTSLTISGLTNGVAHFVKIRAVNELGGDPAQAWSTAQYPNKPQPTVAFSYSVSTVAFSSAASYSPTFSSNSLGDITFSTTTPTKCSVATNSGVVTNLNAGLCTIQLSQAESPTYSAVTLVRNINTTMINQPTLQISASATSSPYLGTVTLTSFGGAGVGAVTYTAAVGSACVVSGNVVTVGNAGSSCAVIATKASDGNYYAANSSQISITTTKINQAPLTFSNRAEMQARSSMSVSAIGGSGDGVIRYRISNVGTTGCSLNGTTLTATSAGQCTIEASRASSTNYTVSASVSQVIEVVKSTQTIRFITNVPAQPLVGSSYMPAATASSGLSISFSVSGGGCSISSATITFTAAGDCKVEASQAGDGAFLAAPTASQTIAVGRRNHTLAFSTTSQNITAKTFGDQAFVIFANSTEAEAQVAFTLSPQTTNDACSVLSSGLVLVLNVGDCVVEAYSAQTQALAAASTISKRIEIRPDKASAPFITSVAMGNLSITAGFTPPSYTGGSSVSAYTVVAIDQTSNNPTDVSDSSCGPNLVNGQITCRISGLENGKSYKIKVAAVNGAGEGEFSILSPAITVATNPAAVQNLRVIQGASTLTISWDDPDSLGGGTFSAYRVYVKRSSGAAYNSDHYFNVTNQSTRSISISAETPPDGMSHPGGPSLVNGVAYDIKVVTVTTANTQELTGNTAVVNQIPRTVPEPPRLASALVVGNKLALTWTAPLNDGGAAITSYSAIVGGTPCVFSTVSENYCEITLPTAPGDYPFSITAQNVAGSSAALQGVYTVAAPLSRPVTRPPGGVIAPPSGGGGGIIIDEPAKPSESAPIIASVAFSSSKKNHVVIRGSHLRGVEKVVIGGQVARIISQTTEMILLESPSLKPGAHSVLIYVRDGDVLRHAVDLIVPGKPVVVKTVKSQVMGFKPGSSVLTATMQLGILKALKANKSAKMLQCVGHTQGPTILKSDARLAMKRAKAVCEFAKRKGFKAVFSSYQNNTKMGVVFRRVDMFFTR